MKHKIAISASGFMATAISFGPARMGFGLFLPTFRDTFALSTMQAGLIASLGFLGFFIGLFFANILCKRWNDRTPIMLGAFCAMVGFLSVANAESFALLAMGIMVAGVSAGLCWPPFNDIAEQSLPDYKKSETLSIISTGTAIGVALTGGLFLGVVFDYFEWRFAWEVFMAISVLLCLVIIVAIPKQSSYPHVSASTKSWIFCKEMIPLYIVAICFGACNAIYLSFAAEHVINAGGLSGMHNNAAAAVIFLIYGIFGVAGLATSKIEMRIGLTPLLTLIFLAFFASLLLLAFMPAMWFSLMLSAALHGAAVMMISAILSFWSLRLFPEKGTQSLTMALYGVAAGSVLGPAFAGWFASLTSLTSALAVSSLIPLTGICLYIKRDSICYRLGTTSNAVSDQ